MYCRTVAVEPARPLLDSCLAIFLVEVPRLYFAFLVSVFAVLLRTAGLPVLGLSSKSPRRDHFFTQRSLLCNVFDVDRIDIPEALKTEAVLVYKLFHSFIFVNEDNLLKHAKTGRLLKARKKRETEKHARSQFAHFGGKT